MEYEQGALESMAVNASRSFELQGNQSKDCNTPSLTDLLSMNKQIEDKADKHFATKLKEEFKCDSKGATSALSTAIQHLEDKMQVSAKYLPPLVKSTRPSDPQEHEGFGVLAVQHMAYKLRLVLLSRQLPVCGGRRRDGDLRQMFGVCAAQGGERSRHHLAAAAVQEPSIHSDGFQAAKFEADARMADFPATEAKRRAVGWAGWNFSQSLSGGLF
jgi:hypothetical protein